MGFSLRKILFPLFLANITLAANKFELLYLPIGVALYYATILIVLRVVYYSRYRLFGAIVFMLSVMFKVAFLMLGWPFLDVAQIITLGALFAVAGALVYINNHRLLLVQLRVFFLVTFPVLIAQKVGVSSFFYLWNTEIFHPNDIYSFLDSDVGSLSFVYPFVPTLFERADGLVYLIGQGRPSGLLYSNNVLSVFLLQVIALQLFLKPLKKTFFYDLILSFSVPLVASLMVLIGSLVLIGLGVKSRYSYIRSHSVRFGLFFVFAYGMHYVLFPGLSDVGFSKAKFVLSIVTRFDGVVHALHLGFLSEMFLYWMNSIGLSYRFNALGETFSLLDVLAKKGFLIPAVMLLGVLIMRAKKIYAEGKEDGNVFAVFLLACLMSQVAVPYYFAPSFQFVLGFGLIPLICRPFTNGYLEGTSKKSEKQQVVIKRLYNLSEKA